MNVVLYLHYILHYNTVYQYDISLQRCSEMDVEKTNK